MPVIAPGTQGVNTCLIDRRMLYVTENHHMLALGSTECSRNTLRSSETGDKQNRCVKSMTSSRCLERIALCPPGTHAVGSHARWFLHLAKGVLR